MKIRIKDKQYIGVIAIAFLLLLVFIAKSISDNRRQKDLDRVQSLLKTNDSIEGLLREKYKWAQIRLGLPEEIKNVFTIGDTTFFILERDTLIIIDDK